MTSTTIRIIKILRVFLSLITETRSVLLQNLVFFRLFFFDSSVYLYNPCPVWSVKGKGGEIIFI